MEFDIEAYYESLFDSYDEDDYVSEAAVPKNIKFEVGQVFYAIYPYDTIHPAQKDKHDEGGFSCQRRCVILPLPTGELKLFVASRIDGKVIPPTAYHVGKIDGCFTRDVFLWTTRFITPKVKYLLKMHNKLPQIHIANACNTINYVHKHPYNNPIDTLCLIKSYVEGETTHPSGNNNMNKVQSLHSIIKTRRCNCVDVAHAFHITCNVCRSVRMHAIVHTHYLNADKSKGMGHVYCVYRVGKKWRVARILPGNSETRTVGELWAYEEPGLYLNDVVYLESHGELMDHFKEILGKDATVHNNIYIGKSLKYWDHLVKSGATQKEVLSQMQERCSPPKPTDEAFDNISVFDYVNI